MKHAVHHFRDHEIPFCWDPGLSVNLCFPRSQQNKQTKNSLLLWIQDEWEKKNRKQHLIRKSVFPESRELRVSRGILTHFHLTWLLHSRDWQKPQRILKSEGGKKKEALNCMCPLFKCKELKREEEDSTNMWIYQHAEGSTHLNPGRINHFKGGIF